MVLSRNFHVRTDGEEDDEAENELMSARPRLPLCDNNIRRLWADDKGQNNFDQEDLLSEGRLPGRYLGRIEYSHFTIRYWSLGHAAFSI